MFKIIIALSFLIFLFACENSSELSASKHSVQLDAIEKQVVDNELLIEISESESMCNFCSSYKISIFSSGKVNIENRKFVGNNSNQGEKFGEKIENLSRNLSEGQLQNLIKEFEKIGFLDLQDSYIPKSNCPETLSDSTTFHIFYSNEKKSKTVNYYRGCRGTEDLVKLAKLRESFNKIFRMDNLLTESIMVNTNN